MFGARVVADMVCAQATTEVAVPLHAAYDAWSDITRHPHFVHGVRRVEPVDEVTWRLYGRGLGGHPAWTVRVAQRVEDEHVTLHSLDGPWDAAVALFERLSPERTAVTLLRDHEPEAGAAPDLIQVVQGELDRFRRHVESVHTGRASIAPPLLHGI